MNFSMRILCGILSLVFALGLLSCSDNGTTSQSTTSIKNTSISSSTSTSESTTDSTTSQGESTQMTTTGEKVTAPPANNTYYNPLTGLATTKELSKMRPVAIVLNNTRSSRAQNGIANADILYETFVESTTRFLMITQNYAALSTVGAIRSVRAYHVDIASAHGAILIGAGASDIGFSEISKQNYDFINALNYEYNNSPYFWRDSTRVNKISYEDALVTNGGGIKLIIEQKKYTTALNTSEDTLFCFVGVNSEKTMADGASAKNISIPYTSVCTSNFTYDSKTKSYKFSQYDGTPYIDANTNKQVSFENVLILVTDINKVAGNSDGEWDISTVGSGNGYYCYGGKWIAINWSRAESGEFVYTYPNGNPLDMARGKTYVGIIRQSIEDVMKIS